MTWRIPPLGWCAVCLWAYANEDDARHAITTSQGTAMCREHLHMIADRVYFPGMDYAKLTAEAEPCRDE